MSRDTTPVTAMVGYTLRSTLPARRWIGVLVPCAAALLFGLLARGLHGDVTDEFPAVASVALFGLVLPVTCLVVGDAVLGAEARSGALTTTWMSPVPAWQIILARWAGGTAIAASSIAAAFALAAVAAGDSGRAGPVALAGAAGAAAYVAVFIAIGCVARRAAVWSLAFVFLVERLLGAALSGIAQLSPSWEARAAFIGWIDTDADLVRSGIPQGTAAIVRLALITTLVLVVASRRLAHLHLTGSSD